MLLKTENERGRRRKAFLPQKILPKRWAKHIYLGILHNYIIWSMQMYCFSPPSLISYVFVCVFSLFGCVNLASKTILGWIWNFKKSLQYSINFRLDITGNSIQNQVGISFNKKNSKPLKQVLNCYGVISTGCSRQRRSNLFYMLNCCGVPGSKHIHWKWNKGNWSTLMWLCMWRWLCRRV